MTRIPCLRASLLAAIAVTILSHEAPALSSQARSPVTGTASLAGTVVDASTGRPLSFARVLLRARVAQAGNSFETLTTDRGAFEFSTVPAGTFYLAALAPTYAPAFYGRSAVVIENPGDALEIGAGQRIEPLELRLLKGAVVTGKVIDQYGEPAAGVPVLAIRPSSWPAARQNPSPIYLPANEQMLRTDARGVYRIYGLAPGEYVVLTNPDGHPVHDPATSQSKAFVPVFFPDTTDFRQAARITLASGEERSGLDLKARVVTLLTVDGTLAGPAGSSEDYISLRVRHRHRGVTNLNNVLTSVSRDRRFRAQQIPPGEYWISAQLQPVRTGSAPPGPSTLYWAALPINLTDQNLSNLSLSLQPAMTLSGHVALGESLDGDAAIVSKYVLSLDAIGDPAPLDASIPGARPGADGRFTIVNVTPGRYRLVLRVGPAVAVLASATLDGQPLLNLEIEMSEGRNLEGVVVRVERKR